MNSLIDGDSDPCVHYQRHTERKSNAISEELLAVSTVSVRWLTLC